MKLLKPTKQRIFKKRIFGFDIETCDDNKTFLMASIVGKIPVNQYRASADYKKVFYSKDEFITELKTNWLFKDAVLFATNLSFDFFGTFFRHEESKHFFTLFRGSDLLMAKTYFDGNVFTAERRKGQNRRKTLTFLDSMNYAKLSVAKMGEIIGLSKLTTPSFIGKRPASKEEWDIMTEYNIRDSEITFRFMQFLIKSFEELGATFKSTIASTAVTTFKNTYLDGVYPVHDEAVLLDIFQSYYGGRTEAFCRGYFTDVNYYDFNSLYPSVMASEEFPDPNSLHTSHFGRIEYITYFEGVSHVDVTVPYSHVPLLPTRYNDKTMFPYGKLTGWWTHVELREAMRLGVTITKVHKSHYYTKKCRPFKAFVDTLYAKRNEYKQQKSAMEIVVKLIMNSLYGKLGQKFLDKPNTVHVDTVDMHEIRKWKSFQRVGEYFVYKADARPANFCIPIWATYVTAYGRLKLHKALLEHDVLYCDTDSIMTKDSISTSGALGDLKLEMRISEGIIVRPKFYALRDAHDKEYVKIKGVGRRLNYLEFLGLLHEKKVEYDKFAKFKESIRRELIPNEVIETSKEFSLDDEKREWGCLFDPMRFDLSAPILVDMPKK